VRHLRTRPRRGRGGKSTHVLALIEYWWDQLEGDFARYLGVDARDFIRGTRPWDQFLTYAAYVAQIDGGAVWAAQLGDDRFLPLIAKQMKESTGPARPPLSGYSREVDAMFRVATELRLLRAEIGKWTVAPPILGPVFPSERIQARQDEVEVGELQSAIEVGHRNWREANARIQRR
jgi:hypothetical protein